MTRISSFLLLLFFLSCGVESSEIGADFFNGGAIDLSLIDSATVSLSTIKFDSLITNSTERMLVGSYIDNKLGRTTAASFIQVTIPATTADNLDDEGIVFDYLALTLKHDDYYYNDTTKHLTLNVHRLTSDITISDLGYIYNTAKVNYDESPLGTLTFLPKPHREDSVEVKLSDVLGKELLQKIRDSDEDISDATEFTEYLKGLVVMPDTTTAESVIGFSMQPELRLYYSDKSVVPSVQKYISFPVSSRMCYNWIHGNRTSTNLAPLQSSNNRINAIETDNEAYLQCGVGLGLRVDMPYLRSLTQLNNFHVAKALLDLYPVRKSYSVNTSLPAELSVYKVDKRNGQYAAFESTATLIEDVELGRDTYYQFDVTSFVKEQMALEELNENALLFLTDDETYRSTVNRLYMANPGYDYKTRLRIYFATLNY